MNSYIFYKVSNNIILLFEIAAFLTLFIFYVTTLIDDKAGRAKKIGITNIVACAFFSIIGVVLTIANLVNASKCQTIIKAKLETKYEDCVILDDNKTNVLNDKFDFVSNDIKYEAYYNKKQNAVIINKINTNETEEINDIFK